MDNDAISRSAVLKIIDKHIDMAVDDDQMHYAMCVVAEGIKELPALDAAPDLNTLRDAIYEDACAHGLWDDMDDLIGAQMYVVCREVRELIDAAIELSAARDRGDNLEAYMLHFEEELADVVISSLSLAGKRNIDIDAAVRRKMEINKTRPYKHEEGK